MKSNLFAIIMLVCTAMMTISASAMGQEEHDPITYSCRIKDFKATLDYNKSLMSSSELRLVYENGHTDVFKYKGFSKQLNRHELVCKETGSTATIPAINGETDHLELTLHIQGKETTMTLDNYDVGLGVFIYDNTAGGTNIRNAPKGKVVHKLAKSGDYMLVICDEKNGWWRISMNEISAYIGGFEGEIAANSDGNSWIHYSVIALGTRNYGGETLQLREEPSETARATYSFSKEIMLRPLEIREEWIKVETIDKKHQGWIQSLWLCGNALTTCS